jgi:hypothetical protein
MDRLTDLTMLNDASVQCFVLLTYHRPTGSYIVVNFQLHNTHQAGTLICRRTRRPAFSAHPQKMRVKSSAPPNRLHLSASNRDKKSAPVFGVFPPKAHNVSRPSTRDSPMNHQPAQFANRIFLGLLPVACCLFPIPSYPAFRRRSPPAKGTPSPLYKPQL